MCKRCVCTCAFILSFFKLFASLSLVCGTHAFRRDTATSPVSYPLTECSMLCLLASCEKKKVTRKKKKRNQPPSFLLVVSSRVPWGGSLRRVRLNLLSLLLLPACSCSCVVNFAIVFIVCKLSSLATFCSSQRVCRQGCYGHS